eukprot:Selendium_serpulae@DN5949_c1_g1_i1.p1
MTSEQNHQQSYSEPPLCENGCGFFGSAANRNLCSKCYRSYIQEEARIASENPPAASAAAVAAASQPGELPSAADDVAAGSSSPIKDPEASAAASTQVASAGAAATAPAVSEAASTEGSQGKDEVLPAVPGASSDASSAAEGTSSIEKKPEQVSHVGCWICVL